MFKNDSIKPIKRTKLRIYIGKQYYTFKRYMWWLFSNTKFASKYSENSLEYTYFSHKTPLIRQRSLLLMEKLAQDLVEVFANFQI